MGYDIHWSQWCMGEVFRGSIRQQITQTYSSASVMSRWQVWDLQLSPFGQKIYYKTTNSNWNTFSHQSFPSPKAWRCCCKNVCMCVREHHMLFKCSSDIMYINTLPNQLALMIKIYLQPVCFPQPQCFCITSVLYPVRCQWSPTCWAYLPPHCCKYCCSFAARWLSAAPWTGCGCFPDGQKVQKQAAPSWWWHG